MEKVDNFRKIPDVKKQHKSITLRNYINALEDNVLKNNTPANTLATEYNGQIKKQIGIIN